MFEGGYRRYRTGLGRHTNRDDLFRQFPSAFRRALLCACVSGCRLPPPFCAALTLLVFIRPPPNRLFFVLPPVAAVLLGVFFRAAALVLPPGRAWLVPAALALFCTAAGLTMPANFLTGPHEAAAVILRDVPAPRRILYCGSTDGNFIFSEIGRAP